MLSKSTYHQYHHFWNIDNINSKMFNQSERYHI